MFKNSRKVHVDGQIYHWTVCTKGIYKKVGIQCPDGKKVFPTWSQVTGLSWEKIRHLTHDFSRDDDEGYVGFAISPGIVKEYIEVKILGKERKVKIMRTSEEIDKMISIIQKELDELPKRNVFGDSNEESKKELKEWIDQLVAFRTSGKIPGDCDIRIWIEKSGFSALDDYDFES